MLGGKTCFPSLSSWSTNHYQNSASSSFEGGESDGGIGFLKQVKEMSEQHSRVAVIVKNRHGPN